MANLHYTITISAPKEKVWDTMLGEETYRSWTEAFMPGSYFKGTWEKGSEILFLAPDTAGKESGLKARIVENKPQEFVSMEHIAEVKDGVETLLPTPRGSFENYTFIEKDGSTEVVVDLINLPDDWADMMNGAWHIALQKLKEIIEQ